VFECGTVLDIPAIGFVHDRVQGDNSQGLEIVRMYISDVDNDGRLNLGSQGLEIRLAVAESAVSVGQNFEIPDWVKKNAGWWADGQIGDSDFVSGIQYLISEGIMQIPETQRGAGSGSDEIPSWIKTTAKWWSEGAIDDATFVRSIQWLIEQNSMVNRTRNYQNIVN